MITTRMMPPATINDIDLVTASLSGDRDAFGQIVARYQSLVCSLAYSATGSLSTSEDLAQETFVTAWKQLAGLREPEKLRAWLCGIVRHLIQNARRKDGREPSHQAESLEEISETRSPGLLPAEQAISNEELAILWRSLERIPEPYREPLVLFYREHQSVEAVAQKLELSEDAVKQRLSRGRKLLHEQVLAFVEGALARTNPGKAFTLGVMIALPAMAVSAKAATLGATAKGSATATGAGSLGFLGSILCPLLAFLNLFRIWRLSHKSALSDRERKVYAIFYPVLAGSIVAFVLLTSILTDHSDALLQINPSLFVVLMTALILGYPALLIPLCLWFCRAVKKCRLELPAVQVATRPGHPFWEYRSQFQLLGLPFIHLRTGGWQSGRPVRELKPVKAWIAADDAFAFGVLFAYGAVAVAPISIGACAIGLFSYGAVAVGALAVGGFSFGALAFGACAYGWQASADCAIAWNIASGAHCAIAHQFALGPIAHAPQANNELVRHLVRSNPFFQACWIMVPYFPWLMWVWSIPLMISMIFQSRVAGQQAAIASTGAAQ